MKRICLTLVTVSLLAGCGEEKPPDPKTTYSTDTLKQCEKNARSNDRNISDDIARADKEVTDNKTWEQAAKRYQRQLKKAKIKYRQPIIR